MKKITKFPAVLASAGITILALTLSVTAFGATALAADGNPLSGGNYAGNADTGLAATISADAAANNTILPAGLHSLPEENDIINEPDEPFEEFVSHDDSYATPAPGEASMLELSTTADTLFMHWEKTGYPDDIGGVYYDSESGMMGFLLVSPTQERIDELRAMFDGDAVFTPSAYSYNELRLAQDEITAIMGEGSGIYSTGVGWTSTDRRVHGFGDSGKEFRLVVGVDKSVFHQYSEGFAALYGDRVVVEVNEPVMTDDGIAIMPGGGMTTGIGGSGLDGGLTEGGVDTRGLITPIVPIDLSVALSGSAFSQAATGGSDNFIWLWAILAAGLAGALLLAMRLRSRPVAAMQTANGGIVAGKVSISSKQVADAVRNSETAPSDGLFDKISKQIDSR